MAESKKVFLLGLDGATWDLIVPWVNEGKLPAFKRLMDEGCWSPLESTIPPISPSAWTSIFTGVSPATHNIYGFVKQKPDSYFLSPISSKDRKAKAIWKYISNAGKRVILINIPFSYPPDEVNGIMTTGLGTPSKNSNFVYPPEYKNKLLKEFPDYEVDFNEDLILLSTKMSNFLQQITDNTEEKIRLAQKLIKDEPWDFFTIVFRSLDVTQHYFWNDKELIYKYYRQLDTFLEYLLDNMDEKTILFLCSDHGFGAVKNYVYINNWLEQIGLLKFKTSPANTKKSVSLDADKIQKLLLKLGLRNLAWKIKRSIWIEKILKFIPSSSYNHLFEIDWSNTQAYFLDGACGLLNINLKDREPKGVVEAKKYEDLRKYLIDEIGKLKDPTSGAKIIKKIYTKEALYKKNGKPMEVPDLILLKNNGYQLEGGYNHGGEIFTPPDFHGKVKRPGDHEMNGIFAALGAGINNKAKTNANVCDITPTILSALGVPIDAGIEGNVLEDIFEDKHTIKREKLATHSELQKIREKIDKLKKIRNI